ncbi:Protein RETICULATA, chloroplastic [Glycine soja]
MVSAVLSLATDTYPRWGACFRERLPKVNIHLRHGVIAQINHAIGAVGVVSQECKAVVAQYGKTILDKLINEVLSVSSIRDNIMEVVKISLSLQHASYSYAPPHSSHSDIRANLIRFDASKVAKDKHGWIFDPITLALASGISSGAVTCGSLHMGEIRVGNKRANQRHHICNETFLIWGATTKFRMGRVDGHNPHIRKDLPLTWTNVYEEATNSSVSLNILVGLVVSVALVGMLAPYARIGKPSISSGFLGRIHKAYAALPSSVFEVESPGNRFSGIMYGADGFGCGIIGQGIANLILTAKWYGFLSREHKDIRRRHTCATTCEECCSLWYDLGKTKKVSVWGALKHCTGMAFFCIGW